MSKERWTPARIPDLSDRTVVVTGANRGLGYEATRVFAEQGASVVMACRSVERGRAAKRDVERRSPAGDLTVLPLDLADLDAVRTFAREFGESFDELHVLCNNAGIMAVPRRETADGFEAQFGVNHLGHFALTGLLLDRLVETPGETRVVTQSSRVHRRGDLEFDDLQARGSYDRWDAYGDSKLANLLFAYELQRLLDRAGVDDVTSVACHPGYADTALTLRGPKEAGSLLRLLAFRLGNLVLAQSPEKGALPLLYAAVSPAVDGGDYVGPGGLANMRGYPTKQRSSERSRDEELAARLWSVSEDLTGVSYDLRPEAVADD